ncbi:LysR substrate-binding domain-containing protein [Methylobacterium pseudosasicola]|uniref:DNA-binding transcriptional regulator, LysR family n=1 Tax=Methylobacterium pseudosasicola TaxID=582667 RepID=A0A1I4NKA9_9HYPH|nr:LysR substrate-binding domain-containing protein [Methylobacterium pseudosasicola]SFM15805.1 DNA-binding transcriptional regulator, LysR family [Methylobacterium pseudosasicola]
MINFRLVRHLWLFLAVAEEKHFGRAAKRLGMSQPPLTEQIQALEQALRVRLFDRNRRGAKLTPAGAAILPAVRKFAEQLERLELAVREAVDGQSGTLTIGAINAAIVNELPPLVARLRAVHPQLTIYVREIDSVEAVPALEAGDIDIAFARVDGELGPWVRSLPVAEDRLAVALPRGHRLAETAEVSLRALAQEDFTMASRRGSPIYFDHIVAACRTHGFSPRILHEVRSVTSQIAFVGCGQGIALIPSSFEQLAAATVIVRPLVEDINVVSTAIVWSSARHNPLIDFIIETAQPLGSRKDMTMPRVVS